MNETLTVTLPATTIAKLKAHADQHGLTVDRVVEDAVERRMSVRVIDALSEVSPRALREAI